MSEIEDGMVLAAPVLSGSGNVLLSKGATLKAALAGRLSGYGVATLMVESADDPDDAQGGLSPADLEGHLEHLFRGHEANPLMMAMRDTVLHYRREHHV